MPWQLPRTNDPLVAFARDLQALRKEAGDPPLALMAEHSGLSTATLSNAHAGKKLPTWATVNGYILACGGDPESWSARWESLRLAAVGFSGDLCREALSRWERTGNLTPPHAVDEGELRELLKTLLDFNGLSHRTLARQAPGYSHVTYGAVLRGARPLRAKILYQILIGCGVYSLRSQEAWFHLLSSFSWREGIEGGKLLARVDQPLRYAGDIDLKMLKTILERLERGRGLFAADIVSYDSINALRTAYEDMLALLLSSLQRSHVQLPPKPGYAFNRIVGELRNSSIPNPAAIAALVPLAMPFHPRLRTRVVMALKNAGELLRRADAGELNIRGWQGSGFRFRRPYMSSAPRRPPRRPAPGRPTVSFRSRVLPGRLTFRTEAIKGETMELEPTELSEAIKAVRGGLAAAQQDGDGSPVRFTVKEIVLELGIELRHTASAGGGVKAFVVSADAKGERAKTATHRMTVTLAVAPDSEGSDLLIGDSGGGRGGPVDGLR